MSFQNWDQAIRFARHELDEVSHRRRLIKAAIRMFEEQCDAGTPWSEFLSSLPTMQQIEENGYIRLPKCPACRKLFEEQQQ